MSAFRVVCANGSDDPDAELPTRDGAEAVRVVLDREGCGPHRVEEWVEIAEWRPVGDSETTTEYRLLYEFDHPEFGWIERDPFVQARRRGVDGAVANMSRYDFYRNLRVEQRTVRASDWVPGAVNLRTPCPVPDCPIVVEYPAEAKPGADLVMADHLRDHVDVTGTNPS